jgi:glycerol-3-phosphate dehydrogenase (NAD(P)+)
MAERVRAAVLNAGSWGTALAVLLARRGLPVRLYPRRPEQAEALAADRQNRQYLPDVPFPETLTVVSDLGAAAEAELLILAPITRGMRDLARALAPHLRTGHTLVSVAKGLELTTGLRMSQVIQSEIPAQFHDRVAVLSGPNLAAEVAAEIPTTTVVASRDSAVTGLVQSAFMGPTFRVYTNPDLMGVELGGALKHIIAIGAGINDGLGFGDNTKAALVTRGLAEMTRLGAALGAQPATFHGLSGVGDLVATCASRKSRNHHVGFELARGRPLQEILDTMGQQVAEGVPTTRAAVRLAAEQGVDMPITAAIAEVLFNGMEPRAAVAGLMARTGRDELG